MQSESFQKTVQGMSSSIRKVRSKAVATDVFHFVFVWEGGNGALRVFSAESLVEENEVGETAADFDGGFLERGEVGLQDLCQSILDS